MIHTKKISMLWQLYLLAITALSFTTTSLAEEEIPENYRYYLMIGKPNSNAWNILIQQEKDIAVTAREALEEMGVRLIGYYLGINSARNYVIAAYPDSVPTSQMLYLREIQGLMDNMEFIEILPTDRMLPLFKSVNRMATAANAKNSINP